MSGIYILTHNPLSKTIVVFNLFYEQVKSLLLRMNCVFKNQDLQMFVPWLNQYE